MNRPQRRRLQRQLADAKKASGSYVPAKPRSLYRTDHIRDVVQEQLLSMRQQIEAHRHVAMDPSWQWDQELWDAEHEAQKEAQRVD
jgi:hypothetical protein